MLLETAVEAELAAEAEHAVAELLALLNAEVRVTQIILQALEARIVGLKVVGLGRLLVAGWVRVCARLCGGHEDTPSWSGLREAATSPGPFLCLKVVCHNCSLLASFLLLNYNKNKHLEKGGWVQIPRLREWRERRALTQVELAEKAGVSERSVAGYEAGHGARPPTVRRLAEALGIEVTDLMGDAAHPKVESRSSLEPTLFNGLEDERRLHYLRPWPEYVELLANNVEREIEQAHVKDLNWWHEFNRDVTSLTHLYNRVLPPPTEQTEGERLELLRFSEAIDRLNEVADKMDHAMEPVIAEMHKEMYAKERERRKAAFNAIPKRGVA
jgi:transcriptional regulator with XRE-family HTH domain